MLKDRDIIQVWWDINHYGPLAFNIERKEMIMRRRHEGDVQFWREQRGCARVLSSDLITSSYCKSFVFEPLLPIAYIFFMDT
jgi:hypothetical protein